MTHLHQCIITRRLHQHLRHQHQYLLHRAPLQEVPRWEGLHYHLHLPQRLESLPNTSSINAYKDLSSSPRSRGFINSFDTKVYHTFVNHFDSRASSATLVQTSTSTTMTTSTTPREIEDLVMSNSQEGLGERTKRPATQEYEVFCQRS